MKKIIPDQKTKRRIVLASAVLAALLLACSVYAIVNTKRVKSIENNFKPSAVTIAVQEKLAQSEDFDNAEGASVVSHEDLVWTLNDKTYSANKEVQILNVDKEDENNTDVYIRVCFVPRWRAQLTVENKEEESEESSEADNEAEEAQDESGDEESENAVEIDVTNQEGYPSFGALTAIPLAYNDTKCTYTMGPLTFTLQNEWASKWIFNPSDGYFYYKDKVSPGDVTASLLESVSMASDTYENIDDGVYLQIDVLADAIQVEGASTDSTNNALLNRNWGNGHITIDSNGALTYKN